MHRTNLSALVSIRKLRLETVCVNCFAGNMGKQVIKGDSYASTVPR